MTTSEELENNPAKVNREKGKAAPLLCLLFSKLDYANLFGWGGVGFFFLVSPYVLYNVRKDLANDSENIYTL